MLTLGGSCPRVFVPNLSLLYRNVIGLCLAPANSQRLCGFQQVP